jgi:hypothetical protein
MMNTEGVAVNLLLTMSKKERSGTGFSATIQSKYEIPLVPLAYEIYRE